MLVLFETPAGYALFKVGLLLSCSASGSALKLGFVGPTMRRMYAHENELPHSCSCWTKRSSRKLITFTKNSRMQAQQAKCMYLTCSCVHNEVQWFVVVAANSCVVSPTSSSLTAFRQRL